MVKKELVAEVARQSGVQKEDAQKVIDTFIDTVKSQLLLGINVKITDFINFKLEISPERKAYNPSSGEHMIVPKHYRVKVKLPKNFTDKIKAKPVY